MDNVVTWTMNQYVVMGVLLGVFGFIGFLRGIRRELIVLVAVILGLVIVGQSTDSLVPQVNRFYRLQQFALEGGLGAENPAEKWQDVSKGPELVGSPESRQILKVLVFGAIVLLGYLLGERLVPPGYSLVLKLLGLFTGLFNGFWIAYFLLPIIFPEPTAVIQVPSGEVQDTLNSPQFMARVIALFVFVLIALGLYSASGRSRQRD